MKYQHNPSPVATRPSTPTTRLNPPVTPSPLHPGRLIAAGGEAQIYLSETGQCIHKIYVQGTLSHRIAIATSEYAKLLRLTKKFETVTGLSCPTPIALATEPQPVVSMSRCQGISLDQFLKHQSQRPQPPESLAPALIDKLSRGLLLYIEEFDQPYWDFCCQNILYDQHSDELSLLDFNPPGGEAKQLVTFSPLIVSLGNFVGWLLYQLARPGRYFKHYHRLMISLASALMKQLWQHSPYSIKELMTVVRHHYVRLGYQGGFSRQLWYRSIGQIRYLVNSHTLLQQLKLPEPA